ncbi:BTB/POZ domain-containing protein [Xylariaceae sp. FL1272]|nr:BTB/POZ domain-containing protein [Xylariaceae sp. FL1272]
MGAGTGFGPSTRREEAEKVDPKESLVKGIAKVFNNPKHADVKVYIGEYEFAAHAVVLGSRSLYFEKALSEHFCEGQTKEFRFEEKGTIHAHWRVLEYMYTGDYSENAAQELASQDDDELVKDVRVYVAADYFLMEDLKEHALGRFKSKLQQFWISELMVDCIREIYATTSGVGCKLRSVAVDIAKDHRSELWKRHAFRDLVHEGGDFTLELMGKLCSD